MGCLGALGLSPSWSGECLGQMWETDVESLFQDPSYDCHTPLLLQSSKTFSQLIDIRNLPTNNIVPSPRITISARSLLF